MLSGSPSNQLNARNCTEKSPRVLFNSRSAVQEVLALLFSPKVHYRLHSQPLDPVLSLIKALYLKEKMY